jgi:hypothetical protein
MPTVPWDLRGTYRVGNVTLIVTSDSVQRTDISQMIAFGISGNQIVLPGGWVGDKGQRNCRLWRNAEGGLTEENAGGEIWVWTRVSD